MLYKLFRRPSSPRIEKVSGQVRIFGYNRFLRGRSRKVVLLAYLPEQVAAELKGQSTNRFSNEGIARYWPRALNELGYEVDIISWQDTDFKPAKAYDLVVFHGGKNFEVIYQQLQSQPKIIHFLTGSYWRFNNAQEEQRLADFKKRHGISPPKDRYIHESEDAVNQAADGIIVIGNQTIRQTYHAYPVVVPINNANFPDGHFDKTDKDYQSARQNFLFFAGAGNIHKGLDLLIEAFKELKEHLYIVTVPDQPVLNVYKQELKLPNIHFIGEVPMRTDQFYEIIDKCAFLIFPSCSEGQAGSVVEGMNQGLIPIVSKESGLDADRYGMILKNSTVPEIKKAVQHMSQLSLQAVEKLAHKVRRVALTEHTPEVFLEKLKKAIAGIVNS